MVEGLWRVCRKKEIRQELPRETSRRLQAGADSYGVSLAPPTGVHDNRHAAVTPVTSTSTLVRFKETINGRAYVIEVSAVGQNRWRAQIARLPGGRAALMPFYGTTAQEAATQLSGWLTRASRAS